MKKANKMQIEGTVRHVGQTESVGSNGFQKRLIVVETADKYDNLCPIEFKKDKCALLDQVTVGQRVTVDVNIGGREYNGRYFPSITGWKVTVAERMQPTKMEPVPNVPDPISTDDDDEIPF
jgi:hypothetical protein